METIIKVSPGELNENLLKKIRKFINGKENIDVTISLKEFDPEYASVLDLSIGEAEKMKIWFLLPWRVLWPTAHRRIISEKR